jgi:sarcosine oxidase, subunit gamma
VSYSVNIRRLHHFGLLDVKTDSAARGLLTEVLGRDLPVNPITSADGDGWVALWIGPDHWLLRTDDGAELVLVRNLGAAFVDSHSAATVVSDAFGTFEVTGADAREVLQQGTALDLHPRAFRVGQCACVRFAKIPVVLHYASVESGFHLYAPHSYADYLMMWLERARGVT